MSHSTLRHRVPAIVGIALASIQLTACDAGRLTEPTAVPAGTASRSLTPNAAPARLASATQAATPALPALMNTTYPAQAGRTLVVAPGQSLQQAVDSARLGDVILLRAGASYNVNLYLRTKTTGTGWIVIRTDTPDAQLPAGTRVKPSMAPKLAKLVSSDIRNGPVIRLQAGAHHYRLVGLEIALDPIVTRLGTLVALGDGTAATTADVPHDITIDRSYIHANATTIVQRCVGLQGANQAVIDSYLAECHSDAQDAQALGGSFGSGPFKIVNNHLEGSGEVIMFGGSDPVIPGLVPSDIEIRSNHVTRPPSWKGKFLVKNLFELKNGRRVLVDGNVMENNWQHGQTGFAISLKSTNQSGKCTWCVVSDVTFRNNIVRNSPAGLALSRIGAGSYAVLPTARIAFTNNVFQLVDTGFIAGMKNSLQFNDLPDDVLIAHNTIVDDNNMTAAFGGLPGQRFVYRDNAVNWGYYGIKGNGKGSGTSTLAFYAPNAFVAGNVFVAGAASVLPAGNYSPATWSLLGVTNPLTSLSILSTSIYAGKGTDGKDPGADVALINSLTNGVDK